MLRKYGKSMHLICQLLCVSTGPFAPSPFHMAGRVEASLARQKQKAWSIAEQFRVCEVECVCCMRGWEDLVGSTVYKCDNSW